MYFIYSGILLSQTITIASSVNLTKFDPAHTHLFRCIWAGQFWSNFVYRLSVLSNNYYPTWILPLPQNTFSARN